MIKRLSPVFLILIFVFSCSGPQKEKEKSGDPGGNPDPVVNEGFEKFKNEFVEGLWKLYPSWASFEGFHKYDSSLYLPDENYRNKQLQFIDSVSAQLKEFDIEKLNDLNKTDYYLIENNLSSTLWSLKEFKSGEWNPSVYNLGGSFFQILNYKKQPLQKRMRNVYKRLRKVPGYYSQAKKNIKDATPEHTDLAIQQIQGSVGVFDNAIRDSLSKAGFPEHEYQMAQASLDSALLAVNDFLNWLKNDLKPGLGEDAKSFRIGEKLYEQKFRFNIQSEYSAAEIYEKAKAAKRERHAQMTGIAKELWSKYFPDTGPPSDSLELVRKVLDTLSYKHVHRDSFITAIKKQIPELIDFINENELIYLDPSKPLVVRETPEYMRGVAGASISAPGPYDKDAETYYNVTPLDHYTDEEAESYLREYNYYILQILNIHEAIPGHYAQLVYSNQSPSIIKSILGNGSMIEGWAVYTEKMMLEEGYGNNSPEMWLMYYKWNLRTICNTILDYGVHVEGISREEAFDLLVREAFQEKSEARGKWKRVTLTQVQLCSYFTGFYEISQLKKRIKEKKGDDFDLKAFHEKFLSYGSAPVKYIKSLMLEDLKKK